jgi:hypothetical protein
MTAIEDNDRPPVIAILGGTGKEVRGWLSDGRSQVIRSSSDHANAKARSDRR